MDGTALWISHRGFNKPHAENSYNAFAAARDARFHVLETDLRTTADGHIVLHHDSHMRRTAGCNLRVEALERDRFLDQPLHDGQGALAFDTFAEHFHDLPWILDIKPESGAATLENLVAWCRREGRHEWLMRNARFLVWNRTHMTLLHRLFPEAVTMASDQECRRAGFAMLAGAPSTAKIRPGRTYSLPPRFLGMGLFRQRIIEQYHRRGARVLAFLPERQADVEKALELGVDELLVNATAWRPDSGP
jgi:glycerophosphoryl diester phosphodiesterase